MSSSPLPDPSMIGGVTTPPFVRLPDPPTLFEARARRLEELAAASEMGPYLHFLAGLVRAQHAILGELPEPELPDAETLERARTHEMPPLDRSRFSSDEVVETTLDRLFEAAKAVPKPAMAGAALARVAAADAAVRAEMVANVLANALSVEVLAEHVYVAAALQVHFARLAARLDGGRLVSVGDGVCPACGGPPVASLIVEWPNAHGSRYCACALCGTLWNFVRIRCVSCGSTKGIGYQEVEGGAGTIKAETCDECRTYVKVLYQNKDMRLEPVADDVGSLGLDLKMAEGPYRRAAFDPFLLGY